MAATIEIGSSPLVKQKARIIQLFERKRYAQMHKQLEVIWPMLTNKNDRLEIQFLQAYCSFYEKNYEESSDQFHNFVEQYPAAPQVEEAVFMQGYSLACKAVDLRLDQTITHRAIDYLEQYLADYPAGLYLPKVSDSLQHLRERLMQKAFHGAYLYFRLGHYRAAIVALKNFQQTYPGSVFEETVHRLLLESTQKLPK